MSDITITFEGAPLSARPGESVAAALAGNGVLTLRQTCSGAERGMFCGMGVCQECLVEVDGRPNQRACMTKVAAGMAVRRNVEERRAKPRPKPPATIDDIPVSAPEILVIGAGPGGLSAAIAARRAGAEVVVVDERSQPGGQYFKQLGVASGAPADRQHQEGARLIDLAKSLGVKTHSDVLVWGAFDPLELAASLGGRTLRLRPQRLIVATGAYERGLPVPGWTLPGVMTTGAAQTLWRTARRLPGKRVLIAGNGPLNLQLANELLDGGAEVAAVVEAAAAPSLRHAADVAKMAAASPRLLADGMRYQWRLMAARVPVLHGSTVARIDRTDGTLTAEVHDIASADTRTFEVNVVCLGQGFEPSNELLRALGAAHDFDDRAGHLVTRRDESCRTSIPSVYALGDCTGLGGARAALAEGTIAGLAAADSLGHLLSAKLSRDLRSARRERARHRRFQSALWRLFAAPHPSADTIAADTVLCRCEEVTAGAVHAALDEGYASVGNVKRRTRAGMGRCQGRYCGPLLNRLVAERCGAPMDEFSGFAPRVPVKPVTIADLASGAEL